MATISTPAGQTRSSDTSNAQTHRGPFAVITILFFMWEFMTVWPMVAFAYIAFYGIYGYRSGRSSTT